MTTRPMSEAEVGPDYHRQRVRKCGNCGEGVMFCVELVQYRVNQGNAGREYTYECGACGHRVQDLNAGRVLYQLMIIPLCGGFGGLLLYYGLDILFDTLERGSGGNDLSAVIVVLALFLLGGGLLSLLALVVTYGLIREWNERRKCPLIRYG